MLANTPLVFKGVLRERSIVRGELFTLAEALVWLIVITIGVLLLEALCRFVLCLFIPTVNLSVDVIDRTSDDVGAAFCLAVIIVNQVQDVDLNVMFVCLM